MLNIWTHLCVTPNVAMPRADKRELLGIQVPNVNQYIYSHQLWRMVTMFSKQEMMKELEYVARDTNSEAQRPEISSQLGHSLEVGRCSSVRTRSFRGMVISPFEKCCWPQN